MDADPGNDGASCTKLVTLVAVAWESTEVARDPIDDVGW